MDRVAGQILVDLGDQAIGDLLVIMFAQRPQRAGRRDHDQFLILVGKGTLLAHRRRLDRETVLLELVEIGFLMRPSPRTVAWVCRSRRPEERRWRNTCGSASR